MSLRQAYNKYSHWNLWPQLQGECGVYSFYYATLLLRTLHPGGLLYPEVHPRKYRGTTGQYPGRTTAPTASMRQWAKANLRSAQGELITLGEVMALIQQFGYRAAAPGFQTGQPLVDQKKAWISGELANDHPVLIPFLEGGPVPACCPSTSGSFPDVAPHWSLIIEEDAQNYTWIDPHCPEKLKAHPKDVFLNSNAAADDVSLDDHPDWGKYKASKTIDMATPRNANKFSKLYDTTAGGNRNKQSLKDVLVAVC